MVGVTASHLHSYLYYTFVRLHNMCINNFCQRLSGVVVMSTCFWPRVDKCPTMRPVTQSS